MPIAPRLIGLVVAIVSIVWLSQSLLDHAGVAANDGQNAKKEGGGYGIRKSALRLAQIWH